MRVRAGTRATGKTTERGKALTTVDMNWVRTFKIWWFWAWRTVLASLVVAAVVGFLLGLLLFPFIQSEQTMRLVGNLIGFGIGLFFGLWVLRQLPEKRFSDFRVVLVALESGAPVEESR